jgi:hypothetical protein
MRSGDGGATWQDAVRSAEGRAHSPGTHVPDRPTGRVAERRGQRGRGESWQPADEGRDRRYTWSVAVDPMTRSSGTSPQVPAYAAHGAAIQAHIYRRRAGSGVACARRWPPRAAARDAVRADCYRRPSLRGARGWTAWESSARGNWRACRLRRLDPGAQALVIRARAGDCRLCSERG